MKVMQPTITIIDEIDGDAIIRKLDKIARVCYQSENKSGDYTSVIRNCIKNGHESVIEHVSITFDLHTDIGVLAELTRHRLAAYSVESTRYVKYNKDKDGEGTMVFMEPIEFHGEHNDAGYKLWEKSCEYVERLYCNMMGLPDMRSDVARHVLNKSNKTQIMFTMNLRELRAMFKLRCAKPAHAHIKQVMIPLMLKLKGMIPVIFDDIEYDTEFSSEYLGWYYEESSQTIYTHPKFRGTTVAVEYDDLGIVKNCDNLDAAHDTKSIEINGVIQNSTDIINNPISISDASEMLLAGLNKNNKHNGGIL